MLINQHIDMSFEEIEFLIQIARTGKHITTGVERRLNSDKMTLPQWEVVLLLLERSPVRQQDIVDHLGVDRAAVVRLVDYLENDGWVKRKPNPDDQRSHLIALSDQGREKCARVKTVLKKAARSFTEGLSQNEAKAVTQYLNRIVANIKGASL